MAFIRESGVAGATLGVSPAPRTRTASGDDRRPSIPTGARAPPSSVCDNLEMSSWGDIEKDAPDFALRVRKRFEAGTNKTPASLRRDGAPRISASEMEFGTDGEVTVGMMPGSMKLLDARRDPRVALHSPALEPPKDDPSSSPGDAKSRAGTWTDMVSPGWAGNLTSMTSMWMMPTSGWRTVIFPVRACSTL
jgi:hypothetical protein